MSRGTARALTKGLTPQGFLGRLPRSFMQRTGAEGRVRGGYEVWVLHSRSRVA